MCRMKGLEKMKGLNDGRRHDCQLGWTVAGNSTDTYFVSLYPYTLSATNAAVQLSLL